MNKYRFHLLATSHLPITEYYQSCAYTQKAIKFAKMMIGLGHAVYFYGVKSGIGPVPDCTEFVETHTLQDLRNAFGEGDNRFELGYDHFKAYEYKHDEFNVRSSATQKMFEGILRELPKRYQPNDFLLLTLGEFFKPLTDKLGIPLTCEYGVGYAYPFASYRAFESRHIQNYTYGKQGVVNSRVLDRVIPNFFDPEHFTYVPKDQKDDYLLYIGRIVPRKGIYVAIRMAEASKTKLLMAGQGDMVGKSDYVDFIGWADIKRRNELMGKAKAVLVPTVYLEPFGGVAVEAQLTGTPVITSDHGAFAETVVQGVTGFRCNTFKDYMEAISKVDGLDSLAIRQHAEKYLMDNVKWEYQKWFDDIFEFYSRVERGEKEPFFFF